MINARSVAVNALLKVNKDGAYSNITFDKQLSESGLTGKDKALAATLFYGALDRKITLDYVIGRFSKAPVKKLSPLTREALRIGIYQLMFLERIPESAAVNESVNIVKRSKESRNAGFVNAVLRNVIRNPVKLPEGKTPDDLSIKYSCPKWIIESFIADYGEDNAVSLLKASLTAPPVVLKVNTLKATPEQLIEALNQEGTSAQLCDNVSDALTVSGSIDIRQSELFKNGFFHVQDLSSQLSIARLAVKPGERVLDMCSAPGGKSFTMAEQMKNTGEIVACDLYEKRVSLIKSGAKRLGINIIKADVADATAYDSGLGLFDAVLCDVPCSGLGVLRRKPEIKYKENEDYKELRKIQLAVLKNAAAYLKPQGRILYSTCTLRKAENEGIVSAFLEENKGFRLEYQHTFMPHTDYTDGFFCALLKK